MLDILLQLTHWFLASVNFKILLYWFYVISRITYLCFLNVMKSRQLSTAAVAVWRGENVESQVIIVFAV